MSSIVGDEIQKTFDEIKNVTNMVYSERLNSLTYMIKALYKEFQELIGPEGITLNFAVYNDQTRPFKWNKNGMKLTNDQVISVEEYIERILKPENKVENKYMLLRLLALQIKNIERNYHKELIGKYLPKDTETIKIYNIRVTGEQIKTVKNILEENLKTTEKTVLTHPHEDMEGKHDPVQEALDSLSVTQKNDVSGVLSLINKQLDKK